ncbi:hypothetical protein [Arthrobacter sp. BL-252-APC-1A]|uniref:antitoxin VbhA family protein n=1 Tax=Arthrobacter sp. BL-252-APC-1A TaxID=2606622 RepID=UPI001E3CB16D|nr:hypothetical protein [Arthrobacter sp. BL-252-APC-1A]
MESFEEVMSRMAAGRPNQTGPEEPAPGIDVVAMWPELFTDMSDIDRNAIRQSFAASWHDGWQPDREDVADLAAQTRGTITAEEYRQRIRNRAQEREATQRPADEA